MHPNDLRHEREAFKARQAKKRAEAESRPKREEPPRKWGRKSCSTCGTRLRFKDGDWAPCPVCG